MIMGPMSALSAALLTLRFNEALAMVLLRRPGRSARSSSKAQRASSGKRRLPFGALGVEHKRLQGIRG